MTSSPTHDLGASPVPGEGSLRRRSWRGWFLLVGTSAVTTIGLAAALLPLLESGLGHIWPWAHTEAVLLVGISIVVLAFALYLTEQQRQVDVLRKRLRLMEEEKSERMRKYYDRLIGLLNVSRIIGTENNLEDVFDCVTKTCLETFDCQQVSLMLLDPAARELELRSAAGHANKAAVIGTRQKLGEGIAGSVAEQGKAIILGPQRIDDQTYPNYKPKSYPISSAMVVPITVRGELVGVLNVTSRNNGMSYDEKDLKAVQVFAENTGACIRHAEQAEWMRQTIKKLDAQLQLAHKRPSGAQTIVAE